MVSVNFSEEYENDCSRQLGKLENLRDAINGQQVEKKERLKWRQRNFSAVENRDQCSRAGEDQQPSNECNAILT